MSKIYMLNCPNINDKQVVEEVNKHFSGAVETTKRDKGTLYICLGLHSGYSNMMKSFADELKNRGLIIDYGIWEY